MTKHLTIEELVRFTVAPTTKKEKLLRLARVLEDAPRVALYRGVESWSWLRKLLHRGPSDMPFGYALRDPILKAAGLKSESYYKGAEFFGLNDREMHHLFCWCGYTTPGSGRTLYYTSVTGPQMATRMRQYASTLT